MTLVRKTLKFFAPALCIAVLTPFVSGQTKKPAASSGAAPSSGASAASQSSSGPFESQMLAFGALDHIADQLSKDVCNVPGIPRTPTIVIFDQGSFSSIQSYQSFISNANVVIAAYKTLLDPKAGDLQKLTEDLKSLFHDREQVYAESSTNTKPETSSHLQELWKRKEFALAITGPALGDPVADLSGLLTAIAIASNSEAPGAISIPDSSLAVLLTAKFKHLANCSEKTVVYPPYFGSGSATDFSAVDIQADIQEVDDVRRQVHNYVHDKNMTFIQGKLPTGVTEDTVLTKALTDVDSLYDNFINSLLQVNSSTGLLGSAAVIQGRQIASLLAGRAEVKATPGDAHHTASPEKPAVPPAYVLLATIVAAGGTQHDHKTLWTALTTGDKITYSGGAIVSASLWKVTDKSPVYNRELRYRTPFLNLQKPANIDGVNSGDNLSVQP